MKMLALTAILLPSICLAKADLKNVSLYADSKTVECIIDQTAGLLDTSSEESSRFLYVEIESGTPTTAKLSFQKKYVNVNRYVFYTILLTSNDAQGWTMVKLGNGEVGLATSLMRADGELFERTGARKLGSIDLTTCN